LDVATSGFELGFHVRQRFAFGQPVLKRWADDVDVVGVGVGVGFGHGEGLVATLRSAYRILAKQSL